MFTEGYVVGASISKDIVQSLCFRNILCGLADDDDELDFIVRKMFFGRLGNLRNDHGCQWTDKRSKGFVEQDWEPIDMFFFQLVCPSGKKMSPYAGLESFASACKCVRSFGKESCTERNSRTNSMI